MADGAVWLSGIGACVFGVVVGWITYRTLRRAQSGNGVSDIATVIGAIGGAAVTALFQMETGAFGAYCIGLGIGFFGYAVTASRQAAPDWLGAPRENIRVQTRTGGSDGAPLEEVAGKK